MNVDLSCDRNNNSIADCSGPFVVGDRVHPTCKQLHTYEGPVPNYQDLVCQEDGKWDNTLFSCVLGKYYLNYIFSLFFDNLISSLDKFDDC